MTSSNGNIFRVTGHLCREFTGPRWILHTKASDLELFFDLRLNKRLSKQSWGWWFETLSCPLWHQCNALPLFPWTDTHTHTNRHYHSVCNNQITMMYVCLTKLGHHWFRHWLTDTSEPSHYLNKLWHIVYWILWTNFSETWIKIYFFFKKLHLMSANDCHYV